ncbi:ribbon-helix-helix domain-containing protein [Candidatus Methanoprimaticola sp. MG2]|uniref:ribbon-helix-helix domain-containing protein n=1 Tax=Candidatus Methanoprimaticola sp. MG2 TaxID=3228838 RepID=UPI0039C647EA
MTTMVSFRLREDVIEDLDLLVQLGYGVNRSDIIRTAVRRYSDEVLTARPRRGVRR